MQYYIIMIRKILYEAISNYSYLEGAFVGLLA